jgi:hypothetical protein
MCAERRDASNPLDQPPDARLRRRADRFAAGAGRLRRSPAMPRYRRLDRLRGVAGVAVEIRNGADRPANESCPTRTAVLP